MYMYNGSMVTYNSRNFGMLLVMAAAWVGKKEC